MNKQIVPTRITNKIGVKHLVPKCDWLSPIPARRHDKLSSSTQQLDQIWVEGGTGSIGHVVESVQRGHQTKNVMLRILRDLQAVKATKTGRHRLRILYDGQSPQHESPFSSLMEPHLKCDSICDKYVGIADSSRLTTSYRVNTHISLVQMSLKKNMDTPLDNWEKTLLTLDKYTCVHSDTHSKPFCWYRLSRDYAVL